MWWGRGEVMPDVPLLTPWDTVPHSLLLHPWPQVYGWGVQHPGAMPVMSEAGRFGAQSGQGAEMPTRQQLLEQVSAHHDC